MCALSSLGAGAAAGCRCCVLLGAWAVVSLRAAAERALIKCERRSRDSLNAMISILFWDLCWRNFCFEYAQP